MITQENANKDKMWFQLGDKQQSIVGKESKEKEKDVIVRIALHNWWEQSINRKSWQVIQQRQIWKAILKLSENSHWDEQDELIYLQLNFSISCQ